jgi:Holliday junction resolvasome RuvABC endonuclease subunit
MGHSSTYASHIYGGYLAIIQDFCESFDVPYTGYGVGTIKKHWTGKGNAKKDAMVKEAYNRGFNVKTEDEADALGCLHVGLEEFKGLLK